FLPFGGCRGRCVYCNQQTITGAEELPSPDFVRSVLTGLREPREICYFGGSFCRFGHETVKAYLDAVTECAPAGSLIRFSTYPGDLSDISFRRFIMSYPISCVELGLPSLDPKVLDSCRRDADPQAILSGIETLRDECVPLAVQMMIGLPGQTEESSLSDLRTLARIKGSLPWQLRLYPCLVIENTELFTMMNSGAYAPLSVEEAVLWGGAFIDEALSLGFIPIRVGLQESVSLASAVRGGPHHPALGELIFSEALVRRLVRENAAGPWSVAHCDISKITGHGGYGMSRLSVLSGKDTEDVKSLLSFLSE
ncbi:MAG: radical SAM protein, partial [Synergistaceae bacterium]